MARGANRLLVRAGATPIRIAPFRDGARLRVDLRSLTQWHAFYSGCYDDLWVRLGAELVTDDRLYLDVGSNIGIFAIRVALAGRVPGQVHCFEPLPANVERIRENVALNGVEAFVTVHDFGLSDADATLQLLLRQDFRDGSGTGNASILINDAADTEYDRVAIEVRKLDDHAGLLGDRPVGVIKVDVEGHEDQFFRGAARLLGRDRPIIIAEACRDYLDQKQVTPEQVYRDCLPEGYRLFRERRAGEGGRGTRAVDQLVRASSFAELRRLENIVLVPDEKAGLFD